MIVNVCDGAGVHAAVGRAAVVLELTVTVARAVGVRRPACRSACRWRRSPAARENSALLSFVTMKVSVWPVSSAGPALIAVAQPATRLRTGVLVDVWSAPLVKSARR